MWWHSRTNNARYGITPFLLTLLGACGGGNGGDSEPPNMAPVAQFSVSTADGFAPLSTSLDGSASRDPDGRIVSFRWDFGDGSPAATGTLVSHDFSDPGTYNVRLTVTDAQGASHTAASNVRVRGARLTGSTQILATSAVDSDVNDRLTQPSANNDFLTAQPIPNPVRLGGYVNLPGTGEPSGHLFSGGDSADFFAVSLSGNELIVLNVGDANANLDLMLWDADGKPVDVAMGTETTESLAVAAAGDYFIEVFPAEGPTNPAGGSNYILSVGQDLSIAARRPSRLSDPFVPGELLLATVHVDRRADLHRNYNLIRAGLLGRFARSRLGSRTAMLVRQRFGIDQRREHLHVDRMTSEQRLKYRTLLAIRDMPHDPEIDAVEANLLLHPTLEPDDPFYAQQWHFRNISLPAAWDLTTGEPTGGDDIIVGVVDTGILPGHPDFEGQLVPGYDFVSDPTRARDGDGIDPDPRDEGDLAFGASSSFHGTHVAGTVAARSNNTLGVAGVSWGARIMPLRALGVDGGTSFDVMQAIRYAAGLTNDSGTVPARRADVINLSLGSPFRSTSTQETISDARSAGVILVASAGNESSSNPSYPAAYDGVISVSATTIDGSIAPYSNFGAIDLAAPGGYNATDFNGDGFADGVVSTLGDDGNPGALRLGYGALNGTSMAAPHVSGVIALMKALHPDLTPGEFELALAAGSLTDDLGAAGFDPFYGHGRLNAQKAVLSALTLTGGGGTDPGPILSSSVSAVDLGVLAGSQPITVRNLGSGTIVLQPPIPSETWLTINPLYVDPTSGLGEYELRVDRSGLGEGSYNATARFVPVDPSINESSVTVTTRVAGANPDADAGLIYVIVVDETFTSVGSPAVVSATNGRYAFTLEDVPPGAYRLFAGSDMDNDGFLCDAGEACGAFRTLDGLETIIVVPTATPELAGLDFVAEFRAVIASTATTTGAATTASAAPDDHRSNTVGVGTRGIPYRKPTPSGP